MGEYSDIFNISLLDNSFSYHFNPVLERKKLGFALAIIASIGVMAAGACGYCNVGALSSLDQLHAIIMIGSGSGMALLLSICAAYSLNKKMPSYDLQPALSGDNYFGQVKLEQHFGIEEGEPPFPPALKGALLKECSFIKGKLVKDTHILFFVPSLASRKEIIGDDISIINTQSYWVLMTQDVIVGSRNKFAHEVRLPPHYSLPQVEEAVLGIMFERAVSGYCMLGADPLTYTWCAENNTIVGGTTRNNVDVLASYHTNEYKGVAAVRRFQ